MSKILVTGASGFIGRALVARLTLQGEDVVPLDSSNGDISSSHALARYATQDIAQVFHLAGKTFVPDSWDDPKAFMQTNVQGTINVLEFCRQRSLPLTFVSAYVYGHPASLPIREESQVRPNNPYALSKRLAEEACEFYADSFGFPVTTIRPFNVYGIGQADWFLIPTIIRQALNDGDEISVNDLTPRRDYVYLEDLVTALMATLDMTKGYHVYNVGSGASLSVQDIIDTVQDIAGTQKNIVCQNQDRPSELVDVVADISKAEAELSWHPTYSFRAGITELVQSQRKEKDHE